MMVACPYCGGEVERQPGEVVLTCPYCGTAFTVGGGEVGEHLMGRVNYAPHRIFELFKIWALRFPETPNDFGSEARLTGCDLTFYPYWVYEVAGSFRAAGGLEVAAAEVAVPACSRVRGTPLERLKLSLAGKVYYSHRYVVQAGGKLAAADVGPEEADRAAVSLAEAVVAQRLSRRLGRGVAVRAEGLEKLVRRLVHVPVYSCVYEYGGRSYRFLADASDSRVLYAEIPVEARFRAAALAGAGSSFALAAASFALGLAYGLPAFALVTPLALAGVGAYCLYKASAREVVVKEFFAEG